MVTENSTADQKLWAPSEFDRRYLPDLKFETIDLAKFSTDGHLCPTQDQEKALLAEIWQAWRKFTSSLYSGQPDAMVFSLDFKDVRSLSEEVVDDLIQPGLSLLSYHNQMSGSGSYVFLDNISDDISQNVSNTLRDNQRTRAKKIVVARLKGTEEFGLIGKPKKVERLSAAWQTLNQEDNWVAAKQFSGTAFGQQYSRTGRAAALNDMFENGIIAKYTTPQSLSFFRTFVPRK